MRLRSKIIITFIAPFIATQVQATDCSKILNNSEKRLNDLLKAVSCLETSQKSPPLSLDMVPKGAVMAFDTPGNCPKGWDIFSDAAGRVIIGTGKGVGLSSRRYREEGGEESHKLTINELPQHTHSTVQMIGTNSVDGVDSTVTNSGEHHNEPRETGAKGNSNPHNNMQPYIVLKLCKKQ